MRLPPKTKGVGRLLVSDPPPAGHPKFAACEPSDRGDFEDALPA